MSSRLFSRRQTATVNGKGIEVGSVVCYSRDFLRSTGQYTGTAPFAKGMVTALQPFGENSLAVIDWGKDKGELPSKVLVSNLILNSNRHLELASSKKATTLVSKQTLEQAVQEAQGIVEQLLSENAQDGRLDQLQEAVSFIESILKKSPIEMQQEGASTLDDYLDDAVMPEMAQKIKQDVDMIANMKNAGSGAPVKEPVMASGSDNWVSDRDENGEPKAPELAEVPRLAAKDKKALGPALPPPPPAYVRPAPAGTVKSLDFPMQVKAPDAPSGEVKSPFKQRMEINDPQTVRPEAPALPNDEFNPSQVRQSSVKQAGPVIPMPTKAPAPAAKPSADITQLSSDTLAKMQKALAGSEDLMNDKAAQAFIAAIAEELMNRPVEVEQTPAPAAPAGGVPVAASFHGLILASSEDEDDEEAEEKTASGKVAVAPEGWEGTVKDMKKDKSIDNPYALSYWMKDKGYTSHKGSVLVQQVGGKQLVAAMNRDLQDKLATSQGGSWFATDKDTGSIKEDGGRTPEVAEAHSKLEDNTGIKRPATELPSKFAEDMSTGAALKKVEKAGEELKALYLDIKKVTKTLDSRPVREAVESVYRAYDMFGEAAKVLNKQKMQEDAEEQATEVKAKNKKGSFLFDLALAGEE